MKSRTFVVTGTDTGVGKTFLACLLARHFLEQGVPVAALKPVCSGGRQDARELRAALGATLTLDEINPWHFRAPIAPLLAARAQNRELRLAEVIAHVRRIQSRFPVVIVEGAGGLLSPLGEDFDSRDLITALKAAPIVVCPNRLGAINQVQLVLAALPRKTAGASQVVLMSQKRPAASARGNFNLLRDRLGKERVHILQWLDPACSCDVNVSMSRGLVFALRQNTH